MSIAFFVYYILAIFHTPFIYIVPNIYNISRKKIILGIISIMSISTFFILYLPEYATGFVFALSLLIVYLISINKISAIVFACINYICYIELGYLLLSIFGIFFDISEVKIMANDVYYIIYGTIVSFFLIIISILISKLHLKFLRSSLATYKKATIFMTLFLLTCLALYIFNITYEAKKEFPQELVAYNSIIFSMFFILTAVFLIIFVRLIHQNEQLKYQNRQYEALQDYISKTEALYKDMRAFKHEYLNKLLTMHFYIENNDMDKLKKYYESTILPTKNNLEHSFQAFSDLSNLSVTEFKGLVYNKLVRAQELGINVKIEVQTPVENLCSFENEITELVGIYLDNAIDEAVSSDNPKAHFITFSVFYDEAALNIIVSNTLNSSDIDIKKLDKSGYSTKGEGRGMGLYIAKGILEKCSDIKHNTYIDNSVFYQTLTIPNNQS